MLISATGNSATSVQNSEDGFSLVELMITLVIFGLLASVVVLTLPETGGSVVDEGEAFAARAGAAKETAIVETQTIAMWVSPTGYGFERHDGEGWAPMTRPPFEEREWTEGTMVTVPESIAGRTRVIFDSTGLNDPLTLTLQRSESVISVAIGADGTIRVGG